MLLSRIWLDKVTALWVMLWVMLWMVHFIGS